MFQMQTAASPVIVAMLLGCVLGAGFMVRFLIALAVDGKAARAVHVVRPRGLHYAGDRPRTRAPYRAAVANSASHLAIGVARLTSALASSTSGGNRLPSVDRLHLVTLGQTGREVDFTAERRYRSG